MINLYYFTFDTSRNQITIMFWHVPYQIKSMSEGFNKHENQFNSTQENILKSISSLFVHKVPYKNITLYSSISKLKISK